MQWMNEHPYVTTGAVIVAGSAALTGALFWRNSISL